MRGKRSALSNILRVGRARAMPPGKLWKVEDMMKLFPHPSPLIHPLIGQPSAWRFLCGHPVAVLILAAWALQLTQFLIVVLRWRAARTATELTLHRHPAADRPAMRREEDLYSDWHFDRS